MELLLVALVVAAALAPLLRGRLWTPVLLAAGVGVVVAAAGPARAPDPLLSQRPVAVHDRGYVSSGSCRACHPGHYDSWFRSHHRTMTQVVTPETMLASWHGTALTIRGRGYRLERRGDEFWITGGGPDRRVVLSTGAHHQQLFWTTSGKGRTLLLFQAGWLVAEQRWVPYEKTFLRPDLRHESVDVWNASCIKCHTTAGQPQRREDARVFDSNVAEFGIACEACHGPGDAHVSANRDPRRRYGLHVSGKADNTIVHPARLDARRSAQVCGQCHGISGERKHDPWWQEGSAFRPGNDLHQKMMMLPRPMKKTDPLFGNPAFEKSYWDDGMVRVSGREYMGLIQSPCYQEGNGKFSCLSCHSMHSSDPNDQLAGGMGGDQACVQCHESADYGKTHTHHAAASPGARCYNCHMPHTSYGLLKAIRSHTVSSPTVAESTTLRRPNACNLCHLDKTLAWTKKHLEEWYPTRQAGIPAGYADGRAAGAHWLLSGDAGQRALVAWAMGWAPAKQASSAPGDSGDSWMPPLLAYALVDDYAAVRFLAHRSLESHEGFANFGYSFVAPAEQRRAHLAWALGKWGSRPQARRGRELFLTDDGKPDRPAIREAIRKRDRRVVDLAE